MFRLFNKDKSDTNVKVVGDYETDDNGNIKIRVKEHYRSFGHSWSIYDVWISESMIIFHAEDTIVFKYYAGRYNYECECVSGGVYEDYDRVMESKNNFIKYKETQIKTCKYNLKDRLWEIINVDSIEKEIVFEKTPLEIFRESFECRYKLIESEDELNEYISSTLDCDTWCRMKLYNKMKELGLGDGFINQFADLIGNDIDKYHAMIDLASEVTDKDTLMYLYTYKFGR